MPKQSRDNIEEFFKKGAQKYHFEYKEADWKKLERRLEEAERDGLIVPPGNGVNFWRIGGAIVAILLMVAYFIWSGMEPNNSNNSEVANTDKQVAGVVTDDDEGAVLQDSNQTTNEREKKGVHQGIEGSKTTADADEIDFTSEGSSQQLTSNQSSRLVNDNDAQKEISEDNSAIGGEEKKQFVGTGLNRLNRKSLPMNGSGFQLLSKMEGVALHNEVIEPVVEKDSYKPFVSVGVNVAPDFSSVGLDEYTKPGKRVGLKLDYSVSKRIQIQTGVIYTDNVYNASGDDYNAPSEFWEYGDLPSYAEGECEILDIPINVRYNWLYTKRSRAFIQAGVSTYFMLKEYYEFEYEYNDPNNKSFWESQEVTNHMFGLVNVSAGYEHLLAPRWSFQAEPFIKIPITGIGWGNVDLFTVGSYFSLNYYMFRGNR